MSEYAPEKMRLFTRAWFAALLRGKRSTGETFWVGNYGTALFHQPLLAVLLVMPISESIPAALAICLSLYQLALMVAVLRSSPAVPTPLGWKVTGVIVTLGHAALFAALARSLLTCAQ